MSVISQENLQIEIQNIIRIVIKYLKLLTECFKKNYMADLSINDFCTKLHTMFCGHTNY